MNKGIAIIFLVFFTSFIYGQPGAELQVSLLTCDQGDELYSTFGHTALRILNKRAQRDLVYNYGTFDFDTPGFFMKFLRGKLPYSLERGTYGLFLKGYQAEKRGVEENILNLTNEQKLKLQQLLNINLLPENKYYPYDFFFDNCATRILDIVPKSINGQVVTTMDLDNKTFRDLLHEHLTGMPWSEFGIDLIIGATADRSTSVREATFLPRYLQSYFTQSQVIMQDSSNVLTGKTYEVLQYDTAAKKRKQKPWFTPHLAFLILLLLEVVILFSYRQKAWVTKWHKFLFVMVGLASLLMLFLWFLTDHQACRPNWHLIWANPLYLMYPFLKNRKIKMGVRILMLFGLIIAILNTFYPFLPQFFNPYNFGIYSIILLLIWVDGQSYPADAYAVG